MTLFICIWIIIGQICNIILSKQDLNDGINIRLRDLYLGIFVSALFGPVMIAILLEKSANFIVFKGKKK